jgi:hypothetical protein
VAANEVTLVAKAAAARIVVVRAIFIFISELYTFK